MRGGCFLELVSCRFRLPAASGKKLLQTARGKRQEARSQEAITSSKGKEAKRKKSGSKKKKKKKSLKLKAACFFLYVPESNAWAAASVRSMGIWRFEACFLLYVPRCNLRQWQHPFLRRGRCFLELASCRFRKRR